MTKNTRTMETNSRRCASAGALMLLFPLTCLFNGCGDTVTSASSPADNPVAKAFLAAAPADGAQTIRDVRKILMADEGPETCDAVVKGRVDAGELSPFEVGQAAFALTDVSGHDGETDHNPHECPFCSRSLEDYIAQVSFRDDAGSVIATDSRELFGIEEKSLVTVQGTASIGEDGMLNIDAKAIYIH